MTSRPSLQAQVVFAVSLISNPWSVTALRLKRCFWDTLARWAAAISSVVRGYISSSSLRFINTSFMWKQWACVGTLSSRYHHQWCANDFHQCALNSSGSTPSIAWVYSLVLLSLGSYSSCKIAFATVLWIPFICIISGAYYSSKSNRQWYTLSEVSPRASLVRFFWSV